MLLDFNSLIKKYNVKSKGVIQVGAHFGQEYADYKKNGIEQVVFIEPCKKAFSVLYDTFSRNTDVKLFNCACGDEIGESLMITGDDAINKGMSNSLLKPSKHLQIHPDVKFDGCEMVDVELLDNLFLYPDKTYDMLVMDCQGYEGHVLRGGPLTLKNMNWVYTEVNKDEVYEGNTFVEELDNMLSDFTRVETGTWVGNSWSDAFYVRKSIL